jgi:hypothetical protein
MIDAFLGLHFRNRASREGARDIVFVPNWFTDCEDFPELPSLQGWVVHEATNPPSRAS